MITSTASAGKPRPGRLLMGLPPDTRVVIAGVTWNDYARLVGAVAEGQNCRVAYSGKDIPRSKSDRQGIYAALQVAEVWRVFEEHGLIEQLQSDGKYVAAVSSRFLRVTQDDVERWVLRESVRGSVTWKQRLREWVRNELGRRTVLA